MNAYHTVVMVPLTLIDVDPAYAGIFPPLSDHELAQLDASVARMGIVTPLCVARRNDRYVVLDGHHRLRAAKTHGISVLPCVVAQNQAQEIDMLYLCNLERRHLSPEEYQRLQEAYENHRGACDLSSSAWKESVSNLLKLVKTASIPAEDVQQFIAQLPVTVVSASQNQEADSVVADLQRRLDEAGKLCRKLMNERDALRESVEYYEMREGERAAQAAEGEAKAASHAAKELAQTRRRLVEMSQQLKQAADEQERLKEELERAKERERIWKQGEQKFLTEELEATREENQRLREMFKTDTKALACLRTIQQAMGELFQLLDHMVEPWTDAERKPIVEAYEALVKQWDELREPLSLALGGLPPGRSIFDRLYPDKRHREPLENYLEQQAAAKAQANGDLDSNGRKKSGKRRRMTAPSTLEEVDEALTDLDGDAMYEDLRRSFSDEELDEMFPPDLDPDAVLPRGGVLPDQESDDS